ncbi:hypothetical protein QE385_001745 [Sphingomonas sp. SORGH_AS 950]|uniref:hypothetical protein n=1 Tax=Sphingomonas sp. SORGH_AS_0950 TaxID=3041792 RepID=UPI0027884923|nr:hypothetical protein [Sphingomonas sp. SORGH_AS_0950]MDQ1157418.1 hypothetical protein [Sphingomonas sp. SORGH_AS_0950]
MNDISIGAVGAAIVAGLVSILGLVISKEQKISEFRQAWIDDLRKCMVAYLVQINAISDAIRARPQQGSPNTAAIIDSYKALNEASHGIVLRVNSEEKTAIELLKSMESFESLASINANLTPSNIKAAEENYIQASRALLKHEWKRVKRGEWTYRVSKYIVIFCIVIMLFVMIYLWRSYVPKNDDLGSKAQTINSEVVCYIERTAQSAPTTGSVPFRAGERHVTRRKNVERNGANACEASPLISPAPTKISQNVR